MEEEAFAADYLAGRQAAERLADSWPARSWVPDAPSSAWARGAIEGFRDLVRGQKAIFRASQEGSERGAESLSARPFQGVLESIQNADDVGATEVRFALARGRPSSLLIAHNGAPVDLSHAGAMALPWLTTKTDDADASGRFGIGQKTLRALGGPIEVHCDPFHFVLNSTEPDWADPVDDMANFYTASARETLIRVRLSHFQKTTELLAYLQDLGSSTLLFLRNIRTVLVFDADSPVPTATHSLVVDESDEVEVRIRNQRCTAKYERLRDPASGSWFHRYLAEAPVSRDEHRRHKASGHSTTLGVAVPGELSATGSLYDRLPIPQASGFPFSLNAQFDPDAGRSTLLQKEWNERRFDDLAELVAEAAGDCMSREVQSAWNSLPILAEAPTEDEWLAQHLRSLAERTLDRAQVTVRVPTDLGMSRIKDLVYEVEQLDGVLSDADEQRLSPGHAAIPPTSRDREGRWRSVLDGLAISDRLTVDRALTLFDLDDGDLGPRDPAWFVALAAAAVEGELVWDLLLTRSILLASGERIEPPGHLEPRTLVVHGTPDDLAVSLGVALPIHSAYLDPGGRGSTVLEALTSERVLWEDAASPRLTFEVLARLGGDDDEPVRLSDGQLERLRDAFEALDEDRKAGLGPRVGRNIALAAFTFDDEGKKEQGWSAPASAYLPTAIDRETGNFAQASAATPGLWWIDSKYARVLRRTGGRREIGAQRFLARLGAATQPRLVRPSNERAPWKRDPRSASPIDGVERPAVQAREIKALSPIRSHLIDDRWSPDLDAVTEDIALDRNAKRRRQRGLALLAVLSRSWDRHYADHATAEAVYPYDGYWHQAYDVIATWLARTAESEWLPSASGATRAPIDLALPTEANRIALGSDRRLFLAPVDDAVLRGGVVDALRLRRGPSASSLVAQLQTLAAAELEPSTYGLVVGTYELLSLACPRDGRSAPVDDMSLAQFRAAFGGSARGPGLLLVDGDWHAPKDVLGGPHVFGRHRPFVLDSPSLRPLWRTLNIREPTVPECIAVFRELARAPLNESDVGVVIDMVRWLASHLTDTSSQVRAQLARLPLWVGTRWISSRPVYASEDAELTRDIATQVATWFHGLTSFSGLGELLTALRVTAVGRSDFGLAGGSARGAVVGSDLRPRMALAVEHLRDELARNDRPLYQSLVVEWSRLVQALVLVDEDLELRAVAPHGSTLVVRPDAHMLRDPLALIVRTTDVAGTSDGGGQALASLFTGDRQKVAWAWVSMWQRAEAGQESTRVVLSGDEDVEVDGADALLRLRGQVADRRSGRRGHKGAAAGQTTRKLGEVIVRRLKDITRLQPDDGTLVNQGRGKPGILFPSPVDGVAVGPSSKTGQSKGQGDSGSHDVDQNGSDGHAQGRQARRSVPAPVDDREQLAFDAVRMALALEPQEIQDLRARRGFGGDAMDDLRQLFEIKMSSGPGDNEVTLRKSQAEAARDDPDFFLAVVEGLNEGDTQLTVRFIFDPLRRLQMRITGDVALTGVREVEALEFRFGDIEDELAQADKADGA